MPSSSAATSSTFRRRPAACTASSGLPADGGNDLSTPMPAYGFSGLQPGDCWCLCAERWKEALADGMAPPVKLAGTHAKTLEFVSLEALKAYALDLS